jgi:CRISPR-associated protein Cst2
MSDKTPIYHLTISARATLDLHSLNNEGGEGNQIQTRMVNIVAQDGRLHNVNAISGDMWKHIQAEHLHRVITERGGVPLCQGCQTFNANRINADPDFIAYVKQDNVSDVDALNALLQRCAMDDMEGILVTEGKRSLPRKSVLEFGWVVGLPELTTTDSYFHVKYANERSTEKRQSDAAASDKEGSNLGQAIFHRPASSGVYAVIVALDVARIGFNDITQTYAIEPGQRQVRFERLMESLLYTFLEPRGAMRSTQNPHLVNFAGVVAVSAGATPAPTVSPLKDGYDQEIMAIQQRLEPLRPDMVSVHPFGSLSDFTGLMTDLITNTSPYSLQYTKA